jgi:hypothetical protein
MGYYESSTWAHFQVGPWPISSGPFDFVTYVTDRLALRNLASGKMFQSLDLNSQSKK